MSDCLAKHTEYASQMLADNAVQLHLMVFRHCGGYNAWPCGDHFHVGHPEKALGKACKRDPLHRTMKAHLRRA